MPTLVPLSEDELSLLRTIYRVRLRLFCAFYAFLIGPGSGLLSALLPAGRLNSEELQERFGDHEDVIFGHVISKADFFYFLIVFYGGMILWSGIHIYRRKVRCFLKDIKNGYKEPVSYTIIRKEDFPMTSQYYFALDDDKLMHYEVDGKTWNKAEVGDQVEVYKAVYSGYVFVINDRFTFM